jgi:hypothetical protein
VGNKVAIGTEETEYLADQNVDGRIILKHLKESYEI